MKLSQNVSLGGWILIGLNLVMAWGAIWVFMRMAPAIEIIIEQNEKSLHACEEMLTNLSLRNQTNENIDQLELAFSNALERAQKNITEKDEPTAIQRIEKNYIRAFEGNMESSKNTISAIKYLSEINRSAMVRADRKARKLGNAGAWGIVFMASIVFMIGMLFMKNLRKNLVNPIEEIHSVVQANRNGDSLRKCTGPDAPLEIRVVFDGINDLLDKKIVQYARDGEVETSKIN